MKLHIIYQTEHETLQFAGEELQKYLAPICPDAAYTVSLQVEKTTEDDRYAVSFTREHGKIVGSNPRSVLLGVYKYLHRLGFRFLRPGTEYEKTITSVDEDTFYQEFEETPALRHRGICIEGADSLENVLDIIDWLPKVGYNSFFVQFWNADSFLDRWYSHINNPLLPKETLTKEQAADYSRKIDRAMALRGISHHRVGHGWTGRTLGYEALGWDRTDAELTDEARSMMAQINGKRDFCGGVPVNTNLCYSDEKVRSKFAETVVTYAKEHPEVDYLHLWLADAFNNHCECENCRKKTPSDWYILLINQIDRRLTEENLSTKIVFLLYMELLWPPKTEKILHPERFVMMFAPISRTFQKAYEECPANDTIPEFVLNHITLPNTLEENVAFLKKWQEQFKGDSFVYDYHLGRAHYGDVGYVHISELISRDIHYLSQLGVNGFMSCQELRAAFPNALPNYVMGTVGVNPELTFDQIAEEYYQAAYGNGWEEVLTYLTGISRLCNCDYVNGITPRIDAQMAENMKQALQITENMYPKILKRLETASGIEKLFWQELEYHNRFSICYLTVLQKKAQGDEQGLKDADDQFLQLIREEESAHQKALDVYRIIEVTTNYTKLRGHMK